MAEEKEQDIDSAIRVKVCGITRPADAAACVEAGVDWLGLNFWSKAKRGIDRHRARDIAAAARSVDPNIVLVGVFVDQPVHEVESMVEAARLDLVQLHGEEPPQVVAHFVGTAIKALRLERTEDLAIADQYDCAMLLVDTPSAGYGGSGEVGDWDLATQLIQRTHKRVILAGGLTPDNVAQAVRHVRPFAVDVATGVESEIGIKDPAKVAAFVAAARGVR